MTINSWTFSGNVGADAELRSTNSGEKVLSFRVASSSGFGERKKTNWVDCSFWGKRAESVSSYIRKGAKVTVIGELSLEEFQKRDGTPGTKLAVRVSEIDLPSKADNAGSGDTSDKYVKGGGGGQDYNAPLKGGAGGRGGGKPAFDQDLEDEIPF